MTNQFQCTLVNWESFYNLARKLKEQISESGYSIDLIIAIGRGGYVPGRILSDLLGNKNLTSFKIEHYQDTRKFQAAVVKYPLAANVDDKNILVVDDVSDTGDTFETAVEHIVSCGKPREIRTAAIHHKVVSKIKPDYYADIVTEWHWMVYPWAINEDISTLIRSMAPATTDPEQIRKQLKQDHGIELPDRTIKDALGLVKKTA